uniref:Uncharacterized protein n=1 Tax=Knipowitschia caucasica TaxID=637954 RepID=A0AAV2M502_KNICA
MNTRGGKKAEEPDDGGAILSGSATSCGVPNNEVEELTALVKSLILDQSARDKRLEKEMCLQEQRWKAMQQQFQQIQQQQGQQSEHSELNVRRRTIGIQPSRDYEEDFEDDGPDPGSDGYRPRREPKLPRARICLCLGAVVTAFGDRLPPLWSTLVGLGATVWVVRVCMSSSSTSSCSKDQPIIHLALPLLPLSVRTSLALAGTVVHVRSQAGAAAPEKKSLFCPFIVLIHNTHHCALSSRCRERRTLIRPHTSTAVVGRLLRGVQVRSD